MSKLRDRYDPENPASARRRGTSWYTSIELQERAAIGLANWLRSLGHELQPLWQWERENRG